MHNLSFKPDIFEMKGSARKMLVNPDSLLNLPALGWQVIISCSRMRYFEPEGFELGRDLPMKPGRERSGCFFFFFVD